MNVFLFNYEIDFEHIVVDSKHQYVSEVRIDDKANFSPSGLAFFPNLRRLVLGSTDHTFLDLRRNLKLDYIKYFSDSINAPKIRVTDTRNLKFVWFFNNANLSQILEYWSKESRKIQNMYKIANIYLETL